MNDRISALVLSSELYRDSDSLLSVLTPEYGLLRLIAKGSARIDSKNRFLPFCLYEAIIDYREGKDLFTVRSGKLLESF